MSTLFTLSTENGIILIWMHTTGDDLHLFAAFVSRDNFDLRLHWTMWEPRQDETVIDHEGVTIPVDNEEPIIRAAIRRQRYYHGDPQYRFQPPTVPTSPEQPPIYAPLPEGASPNSSVNPAASTTGLYPPSERHPELPETETEPEEEDYFSGSDTTSQYTTTGLLNREVLLAIAEAETTEP